nr:hypothetical protein [Tanacetum cinerariifolium]
MAPVTPPLMLMMPPPNTYKVGGPSTLAAEGQSFTLPAPGFPVPTSVIEDLNLYGEIGPRVSAMEGHVQVAIPDGSSCTDSPGHRATKRRANLAAHTTVVKMSSREDVVALSDLATRLT